MPNGLKVKVMWGIAGFMGHFTRTGEVFWVVAIAVRDAQDRVFFQVGKGKHPKSLSLEWMRGHALHVYTVRHEGDMCDYLPALLKAAEGGMMFDRERELKTILMRQMLDDIADADGVCWSPSGT